MGCCGSAPVAPLVANDDVPRVSEVESEVSKPSSPKYSPSQDQSPAPAAGSADDDDWDSAAPSRQMSLPGSAIASVKKSSAPMGSKCLMAAVGEGGCPQLRCLDCDYEVLAFDGKWKDDVDYLFFRTQVPCQFPSSKISRSHNS